MTLIRRPDHHQAAIWPRHGPAHQDQMILAVDLDDVQVTDGDARVAVAPGHFVALFRTTATAVRGVRANGTGGAVVLLDTVAGRQTAEAVPLHGTSGAAALAG